MNRERTGADSLAFRKAERSIMAPLHVRPIESDPPQTRSERVPTVESSEAEGRTSAGSANTQAPRLLATEDRATPAGVPQALFAYSSRDVYEEVRRRLRCKGYEWD
jgi:hypothetical protein